MSIMRFMPRLRRLLADRGFIYTVRRYHYGPGNVDVPDVGECRRTLVGKVTKAEDLTSYVDNSGFPGHWSWWQQIIRFIPQGDDMYLYKIEVVK